jgi:membrane protein required for colicin V production
MQVYDVIMLLVLAGAIALGAWKGLAWQLASLSAIFVSYFVAYQYRHVLAARIDAPSPWNVFVSMLILYLGTSLAIWLVFRFVKDFIDKVKLKEFDRHAGALLGAAKGVLLCILVTMFAVTLLSKEQQQSVVDSRSGYYIALLLDHAHGIMPTEVHDVLHPYMHKLDEKLHDHSEHDHSEHDHAVAGDSPGGTASQETHWWLPPEFWNNPDNGHAPEIPTSEENTPAGDADLASFWGDLLRWAKRLDEGGDDTLTR